MTTEEPYIELNRRFVLLDQRTPETLALGPYWGEETGHWFDWAKLLTYKRVVLLAEGLSGKSREFRFQNARLEAGGHFSKYFTVTDLARRGFKDLFDRDSRKRFRAWEKSDSPGWFFLDSVDEARLVLDARSFEDAIRSLKHALWPNLARSHVIISCRCSDWRLSRDPSLVTSELLGRSNKIKKGHKLKVVLLATLQPDQWRRLAEARALPDVEGFIAAIHAGGLEALAERPGDLLSLSYIWGSKRQLGTLQSQMETSIA